MLGTLPGCRAFYASVESPLMQCLQSGYEGNVLSCTTRAGAILQQLSFIFTYSPNSIGREGLDEESQKAKRWNYSWRHSHTKDPNTTRGIARCQEIGNLETDTLYWYLHPRLNHEEVENLNRPVTCKEIESIIRNLPTKVQDQIASLPNSMKD